MGVSKFLTMDEQMKGKVPLDTLGARLILLRREMGWSQREAAEATGVPFGTWQGMESVVKPRKTFSLDVHIAAIVKATGYDRDWLMWGGPLASPSQSGNNDRYTRARARKAQLSAWVKHRRPPLLAPLAPLEELIA